MHGQFQSLATVILAVILFLGTSAGAAPKGAGGAGAAPKSGGGGLEPAWRARIESGRFGEAAEALVKDLAGDQSLAAIETLGNVLSTRAAASGVLDELEKDPSVAVALARAQLLVRIARGDETPQHLRKGRTEKPQEMATEELGRRAGVLLDHADPFVRALAEQAIAVRLGQECEGRKVVPWPDAEKVEWYRKWQAKDGAALLECDFVRQAVGHGWHKDAKGLLASAEVLSGRAVRMVEAVKGRTTPEQLKAIEKNLAVLAMKRAELEAVVKSQPDSLIARHKAWIAMRHAVRAVVMSNPDLPRQPILFATRTGPESGNITNGSLRDAYGPGGDVYIKRGLAPSDPAVPLLKGRLGAGHLRGMDLNWDADKIVFSFLKQPKYDPTKDATVENTEYGRSEPAHLYEMNADGSNLRQLTNLPYNSDIEPCYLPGGDIVYASDQSNYGSQCSGMLGQDKMIVNLYRCSPDGTNVRWLSNNKDFDRYPHVLDNGQLIFVHWEYQERHLWQTHTLWTCRPDGSMTDAIYKQHIESGPMSLREARQIRGEQKLVAVACGHHVGETGALFVVDYAKGINDASGMRSLTPNASGTEGGYGKTLPVEEGGVTDAGGHWAFPYPLAEKSFLAAYSYKEAQADKARNYGLYYVDAWGNKELIHRDRHLSVAYLMPLRANPRPPVPADRPDPQQGATERYATVVMTNADYGIRGPDARPVKYLRIAQKLPWPCVRVTDKPHGYNHLHATPCGAWTSFLGVWDWSPARVIGIVPVEADGSAHFKAPVDQTVYFQALDENYLEIRRMRSNVTFQAGEARSCVGCHETKPIAPYSRTANVAPMAARREPSMPVPPAWGNRQPPNFEKDIQPIFERHCVSCHGEKEPKGGLEFTSRKVDGYMQSYRTIFGLKANQPTPVVSEDAWRWLHRGKPCPPIDKEFYKKIEKNDAPGQLVHISNRFGGAEVTPVMAFGSARSKLILSLREHPEHVKHLKMPNEDWIALVTWVDLNAPYFDTYADKDTTPARWVNVEWPDPWATPPAGEWVWKNTDTVMLKNPAK